MPAAMNISLHKKQDPRYRENPHQKAALYVGEKPAEASVAFATQLHGKELSYINLLDADAALSAVKELAAPTACIVKHATPCGYATGPDIATAFRRAFDGDPLASFGGIVALNKPLALAIAKAGDRAKNAVAGSDAFFPFPDGPELLLNAGVSAIIQPGGSVKDQESIDLVNRRGAVMIFTAQRHFRH